MKRATALAVPVRRLSWSDISSQFTHEMGPQLKIAKKH